MATGDRTYQIEQKCLFDKYDKTTHEYNIGDFVVDKGKVKKITNKSGSGSSATYTLVDSNMKEYTDTKLEENNPIVKKTLSVNSSTSSADVNTMSYDEQVAIGRKNTFTNYPLGAVLIGQQNTSKASNSLGVGRQLDITGTNCLAVGSNNHVEQGAVALGENNNKHQSVKGSIKGYYSSDSFTAGQKNDAFGYNSVAIGSGNTAEYDQSVAIGKENYSGYSNTVAIGEQNEAGGGSGATALGYKTKALAQATFTFGENTRATYSYAIAGGRDTKALSAASVAIGDNALSNGAYAVAMGQSTVANSNCDFAVGSNTIAQAGYSFACGNNTRAIGQYSSAMGYSSKANGYESFAANNQAEANADYTFAIGNQTKANGMNSFAAVNYSFANGECSVVIGDTCQADYKNQTVIGCHNYVNADKVETKTKHESKYIYAVNTSTDFKTGSDTNVTKVRLKFYIHPNATNVVCTCTGFESSDFSYSSSYGEITVNKTMDSQFGKQYSVSVAYDWTYTAAKTNGTDDPLFTIGNGTYSEKSNALVVRKDGNACLNKGLFLYGDKECETTSPGNAAVAAKSIAPDQNTSTWEEGGLYLNRDKLYKYEGGTWILTDIAKEIKALWDKVNSL